MQWSTLQCEQTTVFQLEIGAVRFFSLLFAPDRMFSGVFFWHVDTPIYRDLIWQPSELGPHGGTRDPTTHHELYFIPIHLPGLDGCLANLLGAQGAATALEIFWVCASIPIWAFAYKSITTSPMTSPILNSAQTKNVGKDIIWTMMGAGDRFLFGRSSEYDISESKGKMLTIPEECRTDGWGVGIAQISCESNNKISC